MLDTLLHNWNAMRIIRLVLGIFIIIQSIEAQNYWLLLPGLFIIGIALFTTGCIGNRCSIPTKKQKDE